METTQNITQTLDELRKVIDANGDISDQTRQRILLVSLFAVLRAVNELGKGLERNPFFVVGNFVAKNPKLSAFVASVIFALANVWFISGIRRPLLSWLLGIPIEMTP